jgi:hypothetical protein
VTDGQAHKSKKSSQAVELGPVYSDDKILGDDITAAYLKEVIASKTEFSSSYDCVLAVHSLAASDEEMQNPLSSSDAEGRFFHSTAASMCEVGAVMSF